MEIFEVSPCAIPLRMKCIKKAPNCFHFLTVYFHSLGEAGRGVSGGKTVSCDQLGKFCLSIVNIALRELELSSQTPCWLGSKQENFAFEVYWSEFGRVWNAEILAKILCIDCVVVNCSSVRIESCFWQQSHILFKTQLRSDSAILHRV